MQIVYGDLALVHVIVMQLYVITLHNVIINYFVKSQVTSTVIQFRASTDF